MLILDYKNGYRYINWYKTYFLEFYINKHSIDVNSIKNIIEIGARDCVESLKFAELFPNGNITAFECNPQTLEECRTNSAKSDRIQLVEKLVTNDTESKKFYIKHSSVPINEGAASMCVPPWRHETIEVDTVSMEEFLEGDEIVDLLWIDVQGAELQVLESFSQKLKNVKTIYCEVDKVCRYRSTSNEQTVLNKLQPDYTVRESITLHGDNEVHMILTKP